MLTFSELAVSLCEQGNSIIKWMKEGNIEEEVENEVV
jgi:hypothetical protein